MNSLLPLSAGLVGAWLVSAFVGSYVPTVILMEAESVFRTEINYRFRVIGYKTGCGDPVKDSLIGWNYRNGIWYEGAKAWWPDDTSPYSSKPKGSTKQDFGLWDISITPDTSEVRATLQHSCNGGSPFTTVIGPFEVPPLKQIGSN